MHEINLMKNSLCVHEFYGAIPKCSLTLEQYSSDTTSLKSFEESVSLGIFF